MAELTGRRFSQEPIVILKTRSLRKGLELVLTNVVIGQEMSQYNEMMAGFCARGEGNSPMERNRMASPIPVRHCYPILGTTLAARVARPGARSRR